MLLIGKQSLLYVGVEDIRRSQAHVLNHPELLNLKHFNVRTQAFIERADVVLFDTKESGLRRYKVIKSRY